MNFNKSMFFAMTLACCAIASTGCDTVESSSSTQSSVTNVEESVTEVENATSVTNESSSVVQESTKNSQQQNIGSSDVTTEIMSAIDGLRNYSEPYIVSVGMAMPSETTYCVEINDENGIYTQYSVDKDGNLGKVSYEEASETTFMLYDWLSKDEGYLLNQGHVKGENTQWLKLPDAYVSTLQERSILYLDTLSEGMSNFVKGEAITADLGNGSVELQTYDGKISSDVVAKVIGVDTLGLYESLRDESITKSDINTTQLMNDYIEDLRMNLTFSDAKATIGVYDGVVRYLHLEVGGLGSRLAYSKLVLNYDDTLAYTMPSFESSSSYYDNIKELADYVAEFGSYDEAMANLSGASATSSADDTVITGSENTESINDTEVTTESTSGITGVVDETLNGESVGVSEGSTSAEID